MKKIKIFFGWFTASDARILSKYHSSLKKALKAIEKQAKKGGHVCLISGLAPNDISKLKKLGYDVNFIPQTVPAGVVENKKYKITW